MRTFLTLLFLSLSTAFHHSIFALNYPAYDAEITTTPYSKIALHKHNYNSLPKHKSDNLPKKSARKLGNKAYKLRKVVIDAGHGGKDTGCLSKNANEKEITLGIALKLGNYIKDLMPGVEVVYTRDKDFFVELHERAAIANRQGADLFISIHCNSAPKAPEVHGTETYVMGLHKSRENLEVAMRENAVIALEADYKTNYDGFDPGDPQGNIIFSLYQNAYIEQSIKFASLLEKQFKYRASRASRGVKQEGFLVLYKTTMPAVLIETGFLSNNTEEKYLRSDEGQSLIASAIYRAFKEYKQSMEVQ
jgi:N-acetylmuramoyl-L-alanine amidase